MKDLNELRQKRAKITADQRAILDKAEADKREMTADENTNYENLDKEFTRVDGEIRKEEVLQTREAEQAKLLKDKAKAVIDPESPEERKDPRATPEYRSAFSRYLRNGRQALTEAEHRALQADVDTQGGYMVAPTQMVNELIKATDDQVYVRSKASKFTVPNAASLGVPSLDADPADADWTSELATGSEDSAMAFGKRELTPHPLAKLIKTSNKLLRLTPSIDALVQARLAYKFAVSEEKGFLTGNGAQQPLGLFTASANGISTGRDVSAGNTTTSIETDGLINALYSLKGVYMNQAEWLFHRDAIKQIRKLKDGNGQYLWQPGLGGQPSMILDRPYSMSEFAPNTFTTGLYVGLIGVLSFYWIADALGMTVQRLVELYAATNQTGFIGRLETDGMPVLEEAFARVKLA